MISFDSNILFPACDRLAKYHQRAVEFLEPLADREDVCVCEQVLMEVYCLLRNSKVCASPLSAQSAVKIIHSFRSNPAWLIVDVVQDSQSMNQVWKQAAEQEFAFRGIFGNRMAMTLKQHQVTEFATRNIKDFKDQGFKKVWDPFDG